MNKQRMIKMLRNAHEALLDAGLEVGAGDEENNITPGTQNLIGQLILATAIEGSGESISMSLDKLEKVALELGDMASAIRHSG